MNKIYQIAGLPRSGSTLFCNLLNQNPNFYATHTSGCLDVIFNVRNHWDTVQEHKAHPLPNAKLNVLRSILFNYHTTEKPVVFDKCRGWLAHLEMVENLLQSKAKVLVCIRDIPDVLASMEMLNRETSKIKQPPGEAQNYALFQTIDGRCEYWMKPDALVGGAYNRISDAVQRGFTDRMYFVHYNQLTRFPNETMKRVYKFLEEPFFQHDFNNVEQTTVEDDDVHGYVNLHKIQPKVTFRPSKAVEILGQKLVDKYKQYNFQFVVK